MTTKTVAGPFTEKAARETAAALGSKNHSVFSRSVKDADGYETDERQWFVERDEAVVPDRILGYEWGQIQRMQQRRA
jgi:hypothetical protein